jgi:hypothetical protein
MQCSKTAMKVALVAALFLFASCSTMHGSQPEAQPPVEVAPPPSRSAVSRVPVDAGAMTAASRSSGAAPLSVLFDASNPGSGVRQPADGRHAHLDYSWDFGDAGAGQWGTDGAARNEARGFVAGHVFERPGVYRVTLRVEDPDGAVRLYHEVVTIGDPVADGWVTFYVASSGSDDADGRSEAAPFRTVERALRALGPRTRVLFRRGDTFDVAATLHLDADGPAIVGAYGEGARPVVRFGSAVTRGFLVGRRLSNADLRFVDLAMAGPGGDTVWFFGEAVRMSEPLFLRLVVDGWGRGLVLSATPDSFTGTAVVDCTFSRISANWGMYLGGVGTMILGNSISNPGGSHTLRIWFARGLVMSHNVLRDGGVHSLKFHSVAYAGDEAVSRNIVISHNDFGAAGPWTVAIGPQNAASDERVEHLRYEANVHRADADTEVSLSVWARDVVVVNNVFIGDGASPGYAAVHLVRRGIEPPPRDVSILNNTIYRGDRRGSFTGIRIGREVERATVRNNLASAPGIGDATLISGSGAGLVADHNLLSESPGFRAPAAADFSLVPGSPAIDAGRGGGGRYDSTGRARFSDAGIAVDGSGAPDLGAIEYRE